MTKRPPDYKTTLARYKAIIEYDGTDYVGFQRQAPEAGPTVQGELESALAAINRGEAVTVLGAGRTDTGVHAAGQVVAFQLNWAHSPETLVRALNANLPRAIAVKQAEEIAADFHPRFSAKGRRYRYTILNSPARSPLRERFAWRAWPPVLNVSAMIEASAHLIGRKDFAAFGAAPDEDGHTVREVREARWVTPAESELEFYIEADAFLHRMVRSIVGALRRLGAGELTPADFGRIVDSKDRSRAGTPAPPQGLCLMEVIY